MARGDENMAVSEFKYKFYEKTGNNWEDRSSFTHHPGKYDMVDVDFGDDGDDGDSKGGKKGTSETAAAAAAALPAPKISEPLQSLMKLIFDERAMATALEEFKVDTKKMPLGKLSSKQIKRGFAVLKEIEQCLSHPSATSKYALEAANNLFYTLIPHACGMGKLPMIDSLGAVKIKVEMLESLLNMEVAGKQLSTANVPAVNSLDTQYISLKSDITPLDGTCPAWPMVWRYIQNSHAPTHNQYTLSLHALYAVNRQGEDDRFRACTVKDNHRLLWHGSGRSNFAGIITQGLRIAPPEAPVTGYMFGKGSLYFTCQQTSLSFFPFAKVLHPACVQQSTLQTCAAKQPTTVTATRKTQLFVFLFVLFSS